MRNLFHIDPGSKTEEQLAKEADAFLRDNALAQFIAEILTLIAERKCSWWIRERRDVLNPSLRFGWLDQRPAIRARITANVTGIWLDVARRLTRYEQVKLLDLALSCSKTRIVFEHAFDPTDLAIYGHAAMIFQQINERFPWESTQTSDRSFMADVLRRLMADECCLKPGLARKPILTREAIRDALEKTVARDGTTPLSAYRQVFEMVARKLGQSISRATTTAAANPPLCSQPRSFVLREFDLEGATDADIIRYFASKTGIALKSIERLDRQTMSFICVMLIRVVWPPDEPHLRQAIVGFLIALKPDVYKLAELQQMPTCKLEERFFEEITKVNLDLAKKLRLTRNQHPSF